jgi:hypothetical protein
MMIRIKIAHVYPALVIVMQSDCKLLNMVCGIPILERKSIYLPILLVAWFKPHAGMQVPVLPGESLDLDEF